MALAPALRSPWFIGIAAGVVGILLGSASAADKAAEERAAAPATPTSIVTQEVVVTKEVTPEACVTAIRVARDVFGLTSEFAGVMGDFLTAASMFDVETMGVHTERLEPLNDRIETLGPRFNAAAAACED